MPSRNALIAAMGVEVLGRARRAFWSDVYPGGRHARLAQGLANGAGKVDRLLSPGVGVPERRVELFRDVGADREATDMDAGPDGDAEIPRLRPIGGALLHGARRDAGDGPAPPRVKEGALFSVTRYDGDGRAVRGRHGRPRVSGAEKKAVGPHRGLGGACQCVAVDLVEDRRGFFRVAERRAEQGAVRGNGGLLVADAETDVEGRVRALAVPAAARRHAEEGSVGKCSGRRPPEEKGVGIGSAGRHSRKVALSWRAAQGVWAARAGWVVTAAFLAAGCARIPVAASGAEARARLLDAHAHATPPTRGVGEVRGNVGGRGGSFRAYWGRAADSLVVVGYAGPVRALEAAMLGDSAYVALRPEEICVTGDVRAPDRLSADGVRFLLRPWDFSAPWMRESLERAAIEPRDRGWRLRARAPGPREEDDISVVLDLDKRGEPRELSLYHGGEPDPVATVRYGGFRRYAAGRYPRWIEWTRPNARVRLDVRDIDPLPQEALRRLPPPRDEWRVVSLDDPEGRDLIRRLVGSREEDSR